LADGDHDFSFELDATFFASLEESLIETGSVLAAVVLEKKAGVLAMHFHLKGEVEVTCDRCLEAFMTGIETRQDIFVKTGETQEEIKDDVIMIHQDDHEIEVGQLLYEFIVLALPFRNIHPDTAGGEPGCDPEMIRRLEDHQGGQEQEDKTDPRWDALKGMMNNNK
jgi:uncharacterized metal-binding protein YceD (DUF177 family)